MKPVGTIYFCWNVLEWITKIFYEAVHFCWNVKFTTKLVGTFQQKYISLLFKYIKPKNPLLLERWNCGTKNNPHHNLNFFFQNAPSQIYPSNSTHQQLNPSTTPPPLTTPF